MSRLLRTDQVLQFRTQDQPDHYQSRFARRDPGGRKEARRLYWDTVGHWKRIAVSAAAWLRPRSGAQAEAASSARPVFSRLLRDTMRLRGRMLMVFISLGVLGAAQLYLTWIAKLWAEGPLVSGDHAQMSSLLFRAGLTAMAMVLGIFASRYCLRSVDQRLVQSLRDRAQDALLGTDPSVARRFQTGDLMSRMFNDAGALSEFVREIIQKGRRGDPGGGGRGCDAVPAQLAPGAGHRSRGAAGGAAAQPPGKAGPALGVAAAQQAVGVLGATLNEQPARPDRQSGKGFGAEAQGERALSRPRTHSIAAR